MLAKIFCWYHLGDAVSTTLVLVSDFVVGFIPYALRKIGFIVSLVLIFVNDLPFF